MAGSPTMQKLAEGLTAEVFLVSDNVVLKLFKRGFTACCEPEFHKLQYLRRHLDFVPSPIEQVEREGRRGFTMERLGGICLGRSGSTPAQVTQTMRRLTEAFVTVPPDPVMDSPRDRIARRIEFNPDAVGDSGAPALALLESLPSGQSLCHGDFHPGNILVDDAVSYLIDWYGAGRDHLNCDISKSLFLMRYAPAGLALHGSLYESRREVCRLYIDAMAGAGFLDWETLGQWLFVRAVESLTFRLSPFDQSVAGLVEECVRSGNYDWQRLLQI